MCVCVDTEFSDYDVAAPLTLTYVSTELQQAKQQNHAWVIPRSHRKRTLKLHLAIKSRHPLKQTVGNIPERIEISRKTNYTCSFNYSCICFFIAAEAAAALAFSASDTADVCALRMASICSSISFS